MSAEPRREIRNNFVKSGEMKWIINRLKNSSNRQELQNNSILDAAIKKIQEILQERRVKGGTDDNPDPAWVPYVEPTIREVNADSINGIGIMGSAPNEAATNTIVNVDGHYSDYFRLIIIIWFWFESPYSRFM